MVRHELYPSVPTPGVNVSSVSFFRHDDASISLLLHKRLLIRTRGGQICRACTSGRPKWDLARAPSNYTIFQTQQQHIMHIQQNHPQHLLYSSIILYSGLWMMNHAPLCGFIMTMILLLPSLPRCKSSSARKINAKNTSHNDKKPPNMMPWGM